ncbi:hypothetical protein U14_04424 [Candidatus Moduliflexus flocculans]|uniref:DUF374 domain-containing protein n=1 Tax=Candidatus Moduliflexus flocculans TaxID=1499966 RepID=A0A0S6W488_9BACT|nr:hypothetical protein U14_04424 [Candidatus Moduliflexus flocculans]
MSLKPFIKQLRHEALKILVPTVGITFFYGFGLTWRIRLLNPEQHQAWRAQYRNIIYVGWHEHVITSAWALRHRQIAILVSQSRDGEYLARLNRLLGFYSVRGSSSRGGMRGFLQLADALKAEHDVLFGGDGPKGPAHECKAGPALLAKHSGLPVVPIGGSVTRYRRLRNWDRTIIPLPFATITIKYGEPIFVPDTAEKEALFACQHQIADALNALTTEVEHHLVSKNAD